MGNEERAFLKGLAAFALVFGILSLVYFSLAISFSSNQVSMSWHKHCFDLKDNAAAQKPSPKVIYVGGSNVLFGISAEQTEKELGMPAVNYGMYSGLRGYTLEKAKRVAKPGDVVVLSLEYGYYWYSDMFMFQTRLPDAQYILAYDKGYFESLPPQKQLNMLLQNGVDLGKNAYYNLFYERVGIKESGTYSFSDLNAWGDQTNYEYPNNLSVMEDINFPVGFTQVFPNYDGAKDVLRFINWCKENNVRVVASFPSVSYHDEYRSNGYKSRFRLIADFYRKNKVTLLGEPEDYFYDKSLFYDTKYHLNEEGKKKRTEFIIRKLREYLANERTRS